MKKKTKVEKKDIETLLDYLDREIEIFKQNKGDYPNLILMSKETKDKLFIELDNGTPIIDMCWKDRQDNYRGISIKIKENIFIELKGE